MPIAPGKSMLKTAGIFYSITGAFSFISGISFLIPVIGYVPDEVLKMTIDDFFMISDYLVIGGLLSVRNIIDIPLQLLFIFIIMISIVLLFMGLATVKHCDYLKKSKKLMKFAIANLAVMIISVVLNLSLGSVAGTVVAVLYVWGAYKNNQEYKRWVINEGERKKEENT